MSEEEVLAAAAEAPVDFEEAEKTRKAAMGKAGTYCTVPPMVVQAGFTKDSEYGKGGRLQYAAYGPAVMKDGTEERLRFTYSPIRLNKVAEDGSETEKPDNKSKLFSQAVQAYATVYGKRPETQADIVEYLRTYPVLLRTFQGNDGLIVTNLAPVKD